MNNAWPVQTAQAWPSDPKPSSPYDALTNDQLLLEWQKKKDAIETAKAEEMELRKYIVTREFPKPDEGTNRKSLGNGYDLKAVVKYNYKCDENNKVEAGLNKLALLGNEGSFIADRLVSWTPNFLVREYRELQENAEKGSQFAKNALQIVSEFITITEASPTLEIVEPKKKK